MTYDNILNSNLKHENIYKKPTEIDFVKKIVLGSELLLPFLYKYKNKFYGQIFEIGTSFNPLITTQNFPSYTISYSKKPNKKIQLYLKNNFDQSIIPTYSNFKTIKDKNQKNILKENFTKYLKNKPSKSLLDSVIISGYLNYIDYKSFIKIIKKNLKKQGYIFINFVFNFGLFPNHFNPKKPKNPKEFIKFLIDNNFQIIEKHTITLKEKQTNKNNLRLILIAKLKD